jgi:hypothetical protein
MKKKDHHEDLGVDGSIISTWISDNGRVSTEFIWLRNRE